MVAVRRADDATDADDLDREIAGVMRYVGEHRLVPRGCDPTEAQREVCAGLEAGYMSNHFPYSLMDDAEYGGPAMVVLAVIILANTPSSVRMFGRYTKLILLLMLVTWAYHRACFHLGSAGASTEGSESDDYMLMLRTATLSQTPDANVARAMLRLLLNVMTPLYDVAASSGGLWKYTVVAVEGVLALAANSFSGLPPRLMNTIRFLGYNKGQLDEHYAVGELMVVFGDLHRLVMRTRKDIGSSPLDALLVCVKFMALYAIEYHANKLALCAIHYADFQLESNYVKTAAFGVGALLAILQAGLYASQPSIYVENEFLLAKQIWSKLASCATHYVPYVKGIYRDSPPFPVTVKCDELLFPEELVAPFYRLDARRRRVIPLGVDQRHAQYAFLPGVRHHDRLRTVSVPFRVVAAHLTSLLSKTVVGDPGIWKPYALVFANFRVESALTCTSDSGIYSRSYGSQHAPYNYARFAMGTSHNDVELRKMWSTGKSLTKKQEERHAAEQEHPSDAPTHQLQMRVFVPRPAPTAHPVPVPDFVGRLFEDFGTSVDYDRARLNEPAPLAVASAPPAAPGYYVAYLQINELPSLYKKSDSVDTFYLFFQFIYYRFLSGNELPADYFTSVWRALGKFKVGGSTNLEAFLAVPCLWMLVFHETEVTTNSLLPAKTRFVPLDAFVDELDKYIRDPGEVVRT